MTELPPPIEVTRFDDAITKLWVADYVNLLVVRFGDAHVLIDAGFRDTAGQVQKELKELGVSRIAFLINTHENQDHTGGNAALGSGSTIVSHENCRKALAAEPGFPEAGLPTVTFRTSLALTRGPDRIELTAMPGGHTDGDIVAFFPASRVVYLGDIIVPDAFPLVWLDRGRDVGVQQLIGVVDRVIDTFPDDVRLLSAHGRDYSMQDLTRYRDMLVDTVGLIRTAMEAGSTVDGMKADRLLQDWISWDSVLYDRLNTGHWIDTVYESLSQSA